MNYKPITSQTPTISHGINELYWEKRNSSLYLLYEILVFLKLHKLVI